MATDALVAGGGRLAGFGDDTRLALEEALGDAFSYSNPLVLRSTESQLYAKALKPILGDKNVDALLVFGTRPRP